MAKSYGKTVWQNRIAKSYGKTVWQNQEITLQISTCPLVFAIGRVDLIVCALSKF